jgi:hypothetical protein
MGTEQHGQGVPMMGNKCSILSCNDDDDDDDDV